MSFFSSDFITAFVTTLRGPKATVSREQLWWQIFGYFLLGISDVRGCSHDAVWGTGGFAPAILSASFELASLAGYGDLHTGPA